jgi:non-ribosomal peptide synthetase component F
MGALQDSFIASARRQPQATAVVEPGMGSITYGDLDALSDRLRDRLASLGVGPGDRVGFYVRKSIDSVATLLGTLKTGAAYVPVDPNAPAARGAYILHNCAVKVVVVEAALAEKLGAELAALGATPSMLQVDGQKDAGAGLREALDTADRAALVAPPIANATSKSKDLAYILYTSGSTGKPKGVMLSHENAVGFVDWCSEVFTPTVADRFSSHAPFHFDLSILDIHVCLKHGATLVLIGEDLGKDAPRLAQLIADERISIWYSAPSIWRSAQHGNLASRDYSHLKQVLFAGEGVCGEASAHAVRASAQAALLQPLRPDRDQCLHVP